MSNFLFYLFWICAIIIFYNYFGYGLLLWVITRIKKLFFPEKKGKEITDFFPEVTLVVAAYNEASVLEEKIRNCFDLDYPEGKLSFLFIIDGSTDGSAGIIGRHPSIRLLDGPDRKGKTAALNRAMQWVHTPVTVFCDANAMLNKEAVRKIVSHYQDPGTGGVAGEKKVMTVKGSTGESEGLYWKYESFLKRLDAALYTVTGAAGELFSIRTELWEPVADNVLLDDFIISTRINLKGYRIAYEPQAYASELPSSNLQEERKRKVRISEGAFQSMTMVKEIFNFFKHPVLFFQFVSHRFLRWTLTPLSLPLLFLANAGMVIMDQGMFYTLAFAAQILFYLLALCGKYTGEDTENLKILKIFHYILFMNYSVYLGFFRYIRGGQTGVWEKAERMGIS